MKEIFRTTIIILIGEIYERRLLYSAIFGNFYQALGIMTIHFRYDCLALQINRI
jgi:hypothetical protein